MKTSPVESQNVLANVTRAVNYIKSRGLNTRLFSEFCKENDSDFETVLFHSNIRWCY